MMADKVTPAQAAEYDQRNAAADEQIAAQGEVEAVDIKRLVQMVGEVYSAGFHKGRGTDLPNEGWKYSAGQLEAGLQALVPRSNLAAANAEIVRLIKLLQNVTPRDCQCRFIDEDDGERSKYVCGACQSIMDALEGGRK